MTAFDYVVLVILAGSVVMSALRGLVKEVLSLLAWLAAVAAAGLYGGWMAQMLPDAFPSPALRQAAGYATMFFGTLMLAGLVNAMIGVLVRAAGLSLADRGLGGLFGLARGVLIVMVLVVLAGYTALPQQPVWKNAALSPLFETAVRTAKPMLPAEAAAYVRY
jgi:membrane protein required for colicin V production